MDLTKEKEKIKREIDLIDDPKIIKAIKQLLSEYEEDESPPALLNEPPIEDWEMVLPTGRIPTPAQFDEWMRKDEGPEMTGEEAFDRIKSELDEWRKEKKKKKNVTGNP